MTIKSEFLDQLKVKNNGLIYFGDSRSLLTSASAFGTLRKDLIKNIGEQRVKGFLFAYGQALGKQDAMKMLKTNDASAREKILNGAIIHEQQGYAKVKITKLEVTGNKTDGKTSVYIEGTWEHSHEAEEHIRQFGKANESVCYTLSGYASGYLGSICKQPVFLKEISCEGKGDEQCVWFGKSQDRWNNRIDGEIPFKKEPPIVLELEDAYKKLLEERNNFANTFIVHQKLTRELLKRQDLESIVEIIYDLMKLPVIIEDAHFSVIAHKGFNEGQLEKVCEDFKWYRQTHQKSSAFIMPKTKVLQMDVHERLITPVFLQGDIVGYCSFCGKGEVVKDLKAMQMIIEQVSSVLSLYLLNEKTELEANERMKGRFLEEILSGKYHPSEVLRRANIMQIDLNQPYHIFIVKCCLKDKTLEEELSFYDHVLEETANFFKRKQAEILFSQYTNLLTFLVPQCSRKESDITILCSDYLDDLAEKFPTTEFLAGISLQSKSIADAQDCYEEAQTALRMANVKNRVIKFEKLGMLGPLITANNVNEIRRIASYTLGSLSENINNKKKELLHTLYVFLQNGGNLERTAADIALSLSGLRYRIQKIEELLHKDLRNPETNYQLFLALQALLLIGDIKMDL